VVKCNGGCHLLILGGHRVLALLEQYLLDLGAHVHLATERQVPHDGHQAKGKIVVIVLGGLLVILLNDIAELLANGGQSVDGRLEVVFQLLGRVVGGAGGGGHHSGLDPRSRSTGPAAPSGGGTGMGHHGDLLLALLQALVLHHMYGAVAQGILAVDDVLDVLADLIVLLVLLPLLGQCTGLAQVTGHIGLDLRLGHPQWLPQRLGLGYPHSFLCNQKMGDLLYDTY